MSDRKTLQIKVTGCVRRMGDYELPLGATVSDAVQAADGFGGQGNLPTGVINIRRQTSDGVVGIELNYKLVPADLETTLCDRDTVVVQHDVRQPDSMSSQESAEGA